MFQGRTDGRGWGDRDRGGAGRRARRLRLEHLEPRAMLDGGAGAELPATLYLPPRITSTNTASFLTGPQAGSPHDIAINYLNAHAAQLGLSAADIATARTTAEYRDTRGGVTHIYLQQTHQGLDVLSSVISINVSARGEVINVGGGFLQGLNSTSSQVGLVPSLTADTAVRTAAESLGLTIPSPLTISAAAPNVTQTTTISAPGLSESDIVAKLIVAPNALDRGALAWTFGIAVPGGRHYYQMAIDAQNGQVLYRGDLVRAESYNVFPLPLEDPDDGSRQLVVDPFDVTASPFGWHDTNGAPGAEFTDTRGNNASAQVDDDADNGVTTPGFRPDGGPGLVFDFPLNLNTVPANQRPAAVTNGFYWLNLLHDIHYHYGFDEPAGNFQQNNYGNGGAGNDAVQVDVQDGSGFDNAFFQTPTDGTPGRMTLLIQTPTNPDRDITFESTTIAHEMGHGVSTRLTGGPADSFSLIALQSGSMGEGWGDYWATVLFQKPTDGKFGAYPQGTWSIGQPPTGGGIRRYPYSFDMTIDPLTLDDFNGGYPNNEVHNAGEIWCSTLWDMTLLLEDQHGFDPDPTRGYAGAASAGNIVSLQLVMDALKLQPSNPTFLEARDAILQADVVLTGGQNQAYIWTAFARRGMGSDADAGPNADSTVVTEGFDQLVSAVDDFVSVPKGQSTAINVLSNDSDAQGLNPATVRIVSGPSTGTAIVGSNGTIIYTPAPNPPVTETIIYTVDDNGGDTSNPATVTIDHTGGGGTNKAPIALPEEITVSEDAALVRIGILSNDSDPDGDRLDPASVVFTVQPGLGTFTYDSSTGVVLYSTTPNAFGTDSLTYKVADTKGEFSNDASVTINITSINDPPQTTDDLARTDINLPVNIDVLGNDRDVDGLLARDTLGVSMAPEHGTLVKEANGTFTYTPTNNYSGGDAFRYAVQDNNGARTIGTVSVRVGSPVTIAGSVYADINNNGLKDATEIGIPNVSVTLIKNDAPFITANVVTAADGSYLFTDSAGNLLPGGTYTIQETHPGFFADGQDTAGTPAPAQVQDDKFVNVTVPSGGAAANFNFGERGLRVEFVNAYLDRRAFYASSVNTLAGINLQLGDVWFAFDSGIAGKLAANSSFDGGLGGAAITLYDQNLRQLARSGSNNSGTQVNYTGSAQAKYFLKLSGTNPQVDFEAIVTPDGNPPATPSWQNASNPLDANNDHFVTPNDALVVINLLNSLGAGDLASRSVPTTMLVDTNGDGTLSPVDALLVINHLNSLAPAGADSPVPRAASGSAGAGGDSLSAMSGAVDEALGSLAAGELASVGVDVDLYDSPLPWGRSRR